MKFLIVLLAAFIAVINAAPAPVPAPAPKPDIYTGIPSVYSPYYASPYSYSNYYSAYPSVYSPYYSTAYAYGLPSYYL